MAVLVFTRNDAWSDGYTGYVYRRTLLRTDNSWVLRSVPVPSSVSTTNTRPNTAVFDRRIYVAGLFSRMLVYGEDEQLSPAGMQAYPLAPTVVAGTGAVTGAAICYISIVHKIENLVVSESNLSPGTSLDLVSQGRSWTLPATVVEPHATHIRGYVSMAGALPRRVFEVAIGQTSVAEAVPDATLANHPEYYNDGTDPTTDQLVPPYGKYLAVYNKRLFLAGDPNHPYRVWYSELNRPTAFGENSYFDMRDRETVMGMGVNGDRLIILCVRATYALQGWTDGSEGIAPDMRLYKILDGIGGISHAGIVDINGRLWYPAEDGVRVFAGGFSYMMDDLRDYWRDDYTSNVATYRDCEGADDKRKHCYILLIPKTNSFCYVGNYLRSDPVVGGTGLQPAWSFDTKNRKERCIEVITESDGTRRYVMGDDEGYVRLCDVPTDADDDSDTDNKAVDIWTKHYIFGEPALTSDEGKNLSRLFVRANSESQSFTISVYAGGEAAGDKLAEALQGGYWTQTQAATAKTYDRGDGTNVDAVPEDRFNYGPSNSAGEGWTFRFQSSGAVDFKFRGLGVEFGEGKTSRGYYRETP